MRTDSNDTIILVASSGSVLEFNVSSIMVPAGLGSGFVCWENSLHFRRRSSEVPLR